MTHAEIEAHLVGKKIVSVRLFSYMGWTDCIESLELDDGTKVEFGGNADVAYLEVIE